MYQPSDKFLMGLLSKFAKKPVVSTATTPTSDSKLDLSALEGIVPVGYGPEPTTSTTTTDYTKLKEEELARIQELRDEERAEVEKIWKAAQEEYAKESFPGVTTALRYQEAERWYTEALTEIEELQAGDIKTVEDYYSTLTSLQSSSETFYRNLQAYNINNVLNLIPGYRSTIESYISIIEGQPESEDEEAKANREQILTDLREELSLLADIEANPDKYRSPQEQYEKKPWYEKIGSAFYEAVKWGSGGAPAWQRPLMFLTAPLAPHTEKLEWWHETVDISWGSFVYNLSSWAGSKITGVEGYARLGTGEIPYEPPWKFYTEEAKEKYLEGTTGGYQLAVEILNPAYWVGIPLAAKGVGLGLRSLAESPAFLRAVPEATQLFKYSALAAKYPQLTGSVERAGLAMRPITEIAARSATPAAIAARTALWGFGGLGKATAATTRAVFYPVTAPAGLAARKLAPSLLNKLSVRAVNKLAAEKGLKVRAISIEGKATQYVIEGKNVQVFARDLVEVNNFLESGSLVPKTLEAWGEGIYIEELDTAITKAEFTQILGGSIKETPQGTIYQLADMPDLTIVSESSLKAGAKPRWVSKELLGKADKGFAEMEANRMQMQASLERFELMPHEDLMAQRLQEDRWRRLSVQLSKTSVGEKVINAINASAAADDLARQAAIVWVEDLERMQAFRQYLMAHLEAIGHSEKIFGIRLRETTILHNEQQVKVKIPHVTKVKVKGGREGASLTLGDVLEAIPESAQNPYIFTAEQTQYIKALHKIEDSVLAFLKREQAKLGGGEPWVRELNMADGFHYVHRSTYGKLGRPKVEVVYTGRKIGVKTSFQNTRYYEQMVEGAQSGVQYGLSAEDYVRTYIDGAARIVADQRFANSLRPYGKTLGELIDTYYPGLKERIRDLNNMQRFLGGGKIEYPLQGKTIIEHYPGVKALTQQTLKGYKPAPQTFARLRRFTGRIRQEIPEFPDLEARLREISYKVMTPAEKKLATAIDGYRQRAAVLRQEIKALTKSKTVSEQDIAKLRKQLADVPELPALEQIDKAIQVMPDDVRVAFRRSVDEQINGVLKDIEDMAYSLEGLRAQLADDAVYQRTWTFGGKQVRLHNMLIRSRGKFAGDIPETITVKQFRALRGKEPPAHIVKNGRINIHDALDEIAESFGMTEDELLTHLKSIRSTEQTIRDFEVIIQDSRAGIKGLEDIRALFEKVGVEAEGEAAAAGAAATETKAAAGAIKEPRVVDADSWFTLADRPEFYGDLTISQGIKKVEAIIEGIEKKASVTLEDQARLHPLKADLETLRDIQKKLGLQEIPKPKATTPKSKLLEMTTSDKQARATAQQLLKDIDASITKVDKLRREAGFQYKAAKASVAKSKELTSIMEHPAFQGKFYPIEVANSIRQTLKTESSTWLSKCSEVSTALRTLVAALDVSAPFIHGLPVLGENPALWARATWRHLHTLIDPKVHAKYLLENEAIVSEATLQYGLYIGGSEFYEAMAHIQRLAGGGGRLIGGEAGRRFSVNVLRQTYGRAEAAFGSFGDVARLELWQALKPSVVAKKQSLYELAQTLNKMTGVSSTKGLGIGATQRQIESAFVFFAPRYTRAGFALLTDIFRGGLRGEIARRSIAKLLTGGLALYVGTCYALGQKPELNPLSSSFMTIKVGEHRAGIGGFMTSFVRFLANATATTADDPLWWTDWGNLTSRRDNPFLKFMYSKSSPITSFAVEMITRRDFLGEPLEDAWDYGRYLRDMITPIAAQGIIQSWQETGITPSMFPAMMAEIWGWRSRPKTLGERLREMRDALAPFAGDLTDLQRETIKDRPLTWDDLNSLQKSRLEDDNEDLSALTKEYDIQRVKRGDAFTKLFAEWEQKNDEIKEWRQGEWAIAIAEYQHNMALRERWRAGDNTLTEDEIGKAKNAGYIFREKIKDIAMKVQVKRDDIENDKRYAEVYDVLDEWKLEDENRTLQDKAYDAYIQMMYEEPGLEDEFGNPLYDKIEEKKQEFINTWGYSNYEYVQDKLAYSRDEPELLLEYRKAKEVLKPYWNLEDELRASGNYPVDKEQQMEWVLKAMREEGDAGEKAAYYYELMMDWYVNDRMSYDKARRLPYIKSIFAWVENLITYEMPTIDSVLADKRIELRRDNPEIEMYFLMFYGYEPVSEK